MYIAMNRFKIVDGLEKEFEDVWRNRETHLDKVPGFKNFNLIKGKKTTSIHYMPHIQYGIMNMILLIGLNQRPLS